MQLTTIQKRGDLLPIGRRFPGAMIRNQEFSFKTWDSDDEVAVGKIRDKDRAMSPGQFTTAVLAHFLASWGGESFSGLTPNVRQSILRNSFASDVLYAWFRLRMEVLGLKYGMKFNCPVCKNPISFDVVLDTVEVFVTDPDEEVSWNFQLDDGFKWMNKKVFVLTLSPYLWSTQEAMYGTGTAEDSIGMNTGLMKLAMCMGSILRVEGLDHDVAIPTGTVKLSKRDLERLSAEIVDQQPGIELALEVECPKCSTKFERTFDWMFDSFFSQEVGQVSSSGPTSTRSGRNALRSRTVSPDSLDSCQPCEDPIETGISEDSGNSESSKKRK